MLFTDYSQEKKKKGDKILRKKQFDTAIESNNVTMQIWLGKQRLHQKENETPTTVPPQDATLASNYAATVENFDLKKKIEEMQKKWEALNKPNE
jgi:hypothetical protein